MKKAIIFDLDKTIINVDFPYYISQKWKKEAILNKILYTFISCLIKIIPVGRIRRRLEYWYSIVISKSYISKKINKLDDLSAIINNKVLRRLLKYRKYGYEIFIVSAGPSHFLEVFSDILSVNTVGSKIIFGINVNDLMGRKILVYKNIENNHLIVSIYSDYMGDLYSNSKYNYLVDGAIKKIIL